MGHFNDAATRAATLLLTSSLLVAGCSSSGNSPVLSEDDNAVGQTGSIATAAQPEADPISSDEVVVSGNDTTDETNEFVPQTPDNIPAEPNANDQNSEPTMDAVPDPLAQNRTQVDFGITVPAYQSDALQVRLTWGDTDVTAGWVGDELWSTSLDLPTDTEHTLTVTFFDNNGAIELASFEDQYRTGSNASEMFNIDAEQFNSEQWDADNDGTSNLEELIAGSDPTTDEDSLLEVRDSFSVNRQFSVSMNFEAAIGEERPYFDMVDELEIGIELDRIMQGTTDINAEGNGTHTFRHSFGSSTLRSDNGTRTRLDNAITWEGRYGTFIDGFQYGVDFTNTVTILENDTVSFVQDIEGRRGDFYTTTWESNSNFTATKIEDTPLCKPVAGTFTESLSTNSTSTVPRTTTISKDVDDRYWRVTIVDTRTNSTTEFFIRELFINGSTDDEPTDIYFICDFVDF